MVCVGRCLWPWVEMPGFDLAPAVLGREIPSVTPRVGLKLPYLCGIVVAAISCDHLFIAYLYVMVP